MNRTPPGHSIFSFTLPLVVCLAHAGDPPAATQAPRMPRGAKDSDWKPLKGSWVISQFGGDGPVEIEENLVKIGFGDPLTGIRWEG